MERQNRLPEKLSAEAAEMILALVRGAVAVFGAKTRNETEPDENGETRMNGSVLLVRPGLVSVGRKLYSLGAVRELEAQGLTTEEGDLTPKARETYGAFAKTPTKGTVIVFPEAEISYGRIP